jgi:formylmethanofuran dehydrogenase subunit B
MQFSYRTLLVKVLAKQKKAFIIHLIDYNNIKGFNSAASKQNPPQSPFEKGGSTSPSSKVYSQNDILRSALHISSSNLLRY